MAQRSNVQIERVTPSIFAELFQCPEVLVAHHKQLNNNEWIKVGRFNEEGYRRVAYITPWDCPSKRLKRVVPYELLKIVEHQHLQLIKNDSGTIVEVIMTTQPTIVSVPLIGTISMGTVTIRVCTEPGFDGCVARLHLDCCPKGLGWLWSLRSFVEDTMLMNVHRVAMHCVDFIADAAKAAPSAAALWEVMDEGKRTTVADIKADAGYALTVSGDTCDSARSRGSEEVTQRSLSRLSIASAASAASVYFDAHEELPDPPSDIDTGADATETMETSSRHQRKPSFNINVTAGTAAKAHHTPADSYSITVQTTATNSTRKAAAAWNQAAIRVQRRQAKKQRKGQHEERSDLLLCSQGRLNPTLEALQQTLYRIQHDVDIIRKQTVAMQPHPWQSFTWGAVVGVSATAAAAGLMRRVSRLRQ